MAGAPSPHLSSAELVDRENETGREKGRTGDGLWDREVVVGRVVGVG